MKNTKNTKKRNKTKKNTKRKTKKSNKRKNQNKNIFQKKKQIKAVLFDLDDTLYGYDAPHKKALKQVHKVLNKYVKISFKKFKEYYNVSKAEIHRELSGTASAHNRVLYFQRLIEKTHNTVNPEINLKMYETYWNTFLDNMKLRKDALKVLKGLEKKGIKIAVVSDLTTHIQLRKIHKLKIADYVDILVTSEEAGSEKPHAIMFLLALNKLGVEPKEGIMVGDNTIADVEGANFVGLYTVLLAKGKLSKSFDEEYRKPDKAIKKISKILDLV